MLGLEDFLPVLKGLRNGLEYGSRVRFVHSLVMTFLYKSFNKKTIRSIFSNAWEHGKKLGLFVFLYKLSCLLLEQVLGRRPLNSFIAGFVVGGLVFGKKTPINYQINLYLLSRTTIALAEMVYQRCLSQEGQGGQEGDSRVKKYGFRVLAGLVWALAMWLFFVRKEVLQESLRSSMEHLYIDSEKAVANWLEYVPYSQHK